MVQLLLLVAIIPAIKPAVVVPAWFKFAIVLFETTVVDGAGLVVVEFEVVIAPFPVVAPIVFAEVVPTFTLPALILIPVHVPDVPVRLNAVIVFPCTEEAPVVPTLIEIP